MSCGTAVLIALLAAGPASAITLVDTSASLISTNSLQVETAGGDQAHLLDIVTPADQINRVIDADILLADDTPLVMTWRRDLGDGYPIELKLALAVDGEPRLLELRLKERDNESLPIFSSVGDISTNGEPVMSSRKLVILRFDDPLDPLTDLLIGDADPWQIDAHNMLDGQTFDLILRAGPPIAAESPNTTAPLDGEGAGATIESRTSTGSAADPQDRLRSHSANQRPRMGTSNSAGEGE